MIILISFSSYIHSVVNVRILYSGFLPASQPVPASSFLYAPLFTNSINVGISQSVFISIFLSFYFLYFGQCQILLRLL